MTTITRNPPPLQQPVPSPPAANTGKGCLLIIAAVVILIIIVAVGSSHSDGTTSSSDTQATQDAQDAQSTQDTQVSVQPTFPPQQWSFTGNGNQKTAEFAPLRDTWQLSWTCNPAAYGFDYNLIVELYDANGNLIDTPVNVICKTGVTSVSSVPSHSVFPYHPRCTFISM